MPGWARPTDVNFDHTAATEAANALAALRTTLDNGWSADATASGAALASWLGDAADGFRRSRNNHDSELSGMSQGLLALENAILDASDDARIEQARRETLQEAWDNERDAEIRAEQEAAEAAAQAQAQAQAQADADATATSSDGDDRPFPDYYY